MYKYCKDAFMPYQEWRPFSDEAIVKVWNADGEWRIGLVITFWWGYKRELDEISEGVITKCIRLDYPKN